MNEWVFNANSPSYRDKTPQQLYKAQEQEKKAAYNQRVIQVEKATFTPLISSTTGGMGPETTRFHNLIAQHIAEKKKEDYPDVMKHIRTRIRLSILRGTLVAIRETEADEDVNSKQLRISRSIQSLITR